MTELNQAIRELLVLLNERPFRKRDGSRASLFHSLEKPALAPLPAERFDMSQWSRATLNIDYHIAFDGNFYSVPYALVQQIVEVRSAPTTVEIFHKGNRIASHLRNRGRGRAVTQNEHRPKSHQAYLEWPPSRMVNWARSIGPNTAQLFERILNAKPHPEMDYRSCLGIIRHPRRHAIWRNGDSGAGGGERRSPFDERRAASVERMGGACGRGEGERRESWDNGAVGDERN